MFAASVTVTIKTIKINCGQFCFCCCCCFLDSDCDNACCWSACHHQDDQHQLIQRICWHRIRPNACYWSACHQGDQQRFTQWICWQRIRPVIILVTRALLVARRTTNNINTIILVRELDHYGAYCQRTSHYHHDQPQLNRIMSPVIVICATQWFCLTSNDIITLLVAGVLVTTKMNNINRWKRYSSPVTSATLSVCWFTMTSSHCWLWVS